MEFSQITDSLFIGTTPGRGDFDRLRSLGVTLVINMRLGLPPVRDAHNPPVNVLWLPVFDSPLFPIPVHVLARGVVAALAVLQAGGKVYTHCHWGRHRGVAMGAAILIAQGYSTDQAMALIKQRRPVADPYIWYIRRVIEKYARRRFETYGAAEPPEPDGS
jgi:dual specificity MAP kinase phosphatase